MLRYKLIEKKNPQKPLEAGKYYAKLLWTGSSDTDTLSERISATCTVTPHDVKAVLSALQEQMIYDLRDGKSVSLERLGTFRPSLNGTGSDTKENYDTAMIERVKVVFTPNSRLKAALAPENPDMKFSRVDTEETAEP